MNFNNLPKVYTNLLTKLEVEHIKQIIPTLGNHWSIYNSTVGKDYDPEFTEDDRVVDTPSGVYFFYSEIKNWKHEPNQFLIRYGKKIVEQIAKDLNVKIKQYIRMKVNVLFNDCGVKPGQFNAPHKDTKNPNTISLIYYVDNCDGDTVVFPNFSKQDEKLGEPVRIPPIEGNVLALESMMYHASSNPITHNRRFVINIVFEYEEIE